MSTVRLFIPFGTRRQQRGDIFRIHCQQVVTRVGVVIGFDQKKTSEVIAQILRFGLDLLTDRESQAT